jgi:catechol 2,3-dioxygenase-like lactoylglutathione lyase family enzyme
MGTAEMMVTDYAMSYRFWTEALGFTLAFERPAQKLACLQRPEGAQVMIYQRDGDWDVGAMERPFGRGLVVQIYMEDASALAAQVAAAGVEFYVVLHEKQRDWGDRLGGQREFLVQDPDGDLVMVADRIGERPLLQG